MLAKKAEPFYRGINKTTSIWSLIFVGFVLIFNLFSLSQSNAVFYYGSGDSASARNMENHGGPLVAEGDSSFASGLAVSPSNITDNEKMFMDQESAFAIAASNPIADAGLVQSELRRYRVRRGDTIAKIATKFDISEDTIKLANGGIKTVRAGKTLIILPVSGVIYNVKEGDVIEAIANNYNTDPNAIKRQNPEYQKILAAGSGILIIPSTEVMADNAANQAASKLPEIKNFFTLPLAGLNFGELHNVNAVDIGNKCGVPVKASAAGTVIEDSALKSDGSSGWNDGYGLFVLLEHTNGVRTRYAHLNKIFVKVGDVVNQGDQIGLVGNTGNAEGPTGCHLHFEVLGAKNPFATK